MIRNVMPVKNGIKTKRNVKSENAQPDKDMILRTVEHVKSVTLVSLQTEIVKHVLRAQQMITEHVVVLKTNQRLLATNV